MPLAGVVLLAALATAASAADPFEGKWDLTLTPESAAIDAKAIQDVLTFHAIQLESRFFTQRGFAKMSMEEWPTRMGISSFKATGASKTAGTLKWEGTLAAGELSGTVTWTQKDGTVLTYIMKGSRQAAKDKAGK
jgi:opacity protein-like surface antigen